MTMESIHQEGKMLLNVYVPNNRTSKVVRGILAALKERQANIQLQVEISTCFTEKKITRRNKQKITRLLETETLSTWH